MNISDIKLKRLTNSEIQRYCDIIDNLEDPSNDSLIFGIIKKGFH